MRRFKKNVAIALSLTLLVSMVQSPDVNAAKKPKLNKTKKTIQVGKTFKVKVKNASKKAKVTWKTSKKKVARITKKTTKGNAYAVVKGASKGTSKITAKYKLGKKVKKLTCTITVDSKKEPVVTPAPIIVPPTNQPVVSPTTPPSTTTAAPDLGTTPAPTEPSGDGEKPADPTQKPDDPTQKPADPTVKPTATPVPTPTPEPTPVPTFAPTIENYSYFDEYTLGFNNGIVAYVNGKQNALAAAGAGVYNKSGDNIFALENDQAINLPKITLTQPIMYTTTDGEAHVVDSMLTNWSFIADPTAIDNSENDGKLYVYGTTEGIDFAGGLLAKNAYNNHSLTILSTEDMVNWTDEGTMDNLNLTNEVSTSKDKTMCKWAGKAWAPSGLKIDGDGDGEDEYYLFYTNGGAVGYVMGDSPTGPWKDPRGTTLFTQSSPNCSGVVWCFDPAVLVDDKGDAYVYFGGGVPDGNSKDGKTGRVCKIKFKEGTGEVLLDGDPQVLDTYYFFEDSEINQFNGKYYYSYCANFNVPGGNKWVTNGSIAVYVSSDPMNISFNPETKGDKFTENNVYHHYLGTILQNPSTIYGESYNNHHHMQSFNGKDYIFYHSTVLSNVLYRDNKQYRNLHVAEISVDEDTDEITVNNNYTGAEQDGTFNPYKDKKGNPCYINATTSSLSAGVTSAREDVMVVSSYNNSPMVLDEIDTGDWTKIEGVDFGTNGLGAFGAEFESYTGVGRIEVFIDSPEVATNCIGMINIEDTDGRYVVRTLTPSKEVKGVHDIYFVFRGNDFTVASWVFSESSEITVPDDADRPAKVTPSPEPTRNPNLVVGWNDAKTEYSIDLTDAFVTPEGGASAQYNKGEGSVTLTYAGKYPGVWFTVPADAQDNFSSIEFTYRDASAGGFGSAVRYTTSGSDEEINWGGKLPDSKTVETITLDSSKKFKQYKIFRNDTSGESVTITSVVLKK